MGWLPPFAVHRPQKNILERVAALIQAPDLNSTLRGNDIEIARFNVVRHHQLDAAAREARAFAAQFPGTHRELLGRTHRLQFDEVPVGAALFFNVAERGDATLFKNQHLVAGLIDIAQQVRRDEQLDASLLANLLYYLEHPLSSHRSEPVR